MIPKSFSATSLQVADLCLARWKAEHLDRARGIQNNAAGLGSAVHGGLEMFVKNEIMGKSPHERVMDKKKLIEYYRMSFASIFGFGELDGEAYKMGLEMCETWIKRTSFDNVEEVLEVEVKHSYPLAISGVPEIPFNFIFDRFDKLVADEGQEVYRVVDYKSSVWGIRPDDLKRKPQARIYGLMAQILKPNATRIWVQFDMLRHDAVGIVFSRDDNIATWKWIKNRVLEIYNTPEDEAPETLNAECRFCVRKGTCTALGKNIAAGGVIGLPTPRIVDQRTMLGFQKAAIEAAIGEMDTVILAEARASDIREFESETNRLKIAVTSRRGVDADMVQMVVGPELFSMYGGHKLTLTQFEKLKKDQTLTDDQRRALGGMIQMNVGEPRVKAESKSSIEEGL